MDLHVFFGCRTGLDTYTDPEFGMELSWDIPLLDGYRHSFLNNWNRNPDPNRFSGVLNPGVLRILRGFDAVWVHGWSHATDWIAFAGAFLGGTPVLLRGESNGLREPHGLRGVAKRLILGRLLRSSACLLAAGTRNAAFYRSYGIPPDRIFDAPYTVDNDFFIARAKELHPCRAALRDREGIAPDLPVVLFCGKLVERKRPMDLLRAFASASAQAPASLVFIGTGEQQPALERFVAEHHVTNVHFLGFRNQAEISACYALADLFVLPSTNEPWGLVVNEAMCFGLPVIVSDMVGAAPDLVHEGVNGYVFPAGDVENLSARLLSVLSDENLRQQMSRRSLEIVEQWGIPQTAAGIVAAVRHAAARRNSGGRYG
ncbi:MAG TPA: glycosyltransferase family 4 protein [Bryobacteraceae bacterium]|nr:glycosyltransferase family 4 protein [Bryobacteraceae bacterium]